MGTASSAVKRPWHLERPFLGLLISLVALWCVAPFMATQGPRPAFDVLLSLVLAGGVGAATGSRRHLHVALVLGGLALVTRWAVYADSHALAPALLANLAFLGFTVFAVSTALSRQHRVSSDTITGGICLYLLLGVLWALGYQLLELLAPGSLRHPLAVARLSTGELFYFSIVTMTTLGYGDITPNSPAARVLTAGQAVFGQLFIAIFIARLVGLYTAQQSGRREEP